MLPRIVSCSVSASASAAMTVWLFPRPGAPETIRERQAPVATRLAIRSKAA